ncbi:Rid family hydrolase [Gemmatimonadota bacterium]
MTTMGSKPTTSSLDGIDLVSFRHGDVDEIFATVVPGEDDPFVALCPKVKTMLQDVNAQVLDLRVFGSLSEYPKCKATLREHFPDVDWPMVFIDGEGCGKGAVAGVQLHAVAGPSVETVRLNGRPVGRCFETDAARFLVLGDLLSHDPSSRRTTQAGHTIGRMEEALHVARMDLTHVVRTWFYVNDILDWYTDFNAVRTEIYSERGLFGQYVPASTGIGGRNPWGLAVVGSALAIQPKEGGVRVEEIPSPLQCSAGDYGSSFSRAAEVTTPGVRWVFVSGTASIDAEGNTIHQGDIGSQVGQTLDVVRAILESRGMGFSDVTRANAYFKNPGDAVVLPPFLADHGLPMSRVVVSHHDICRDDLLFEMEVDAVGLGSIP